MLAVDRFNRIKERPRKYEHRMFLHLLVIVMLPLTLAGIVTVFLYTRQVNKQNEMIIQGASEDIYAQYEEMFQSVRDYYVSLMERDEVKWLQQTDEMPYRNYKKVSSAQDALQGGNIINSYVQGYTFLNVEKGWALTNYGIYEYGRIGNLKEVEEFLSEQEEEVNSVYYLNRMDGSESQRTAMTGRRIELGGELLVIKEQRRGEIANLLLVALNPRKFRGGGGMELQNSTFQTGIYDRGGNVICTTDEAMAEAVRQEEFFGTKDLRIQNAEHYEALVSKCSPNGFIYAVGYDRRKDNGMQMQILLIPLLVGAVLLLILYIVRRSTALLYRPIENLMLSIQQLTGKPDENGDEFKYIRSKMGELAEARVRLQEMVARQETQLEELFFIRLIRSEATKDAIGETLRQLGISACGCYRVAAVLPMVSEDSETETQFQQEVLGLEILEKMPEAIKRELFLTPIVMGSELLLSFGAESGEALEKKVRGSLERLEVFIQRQYGCPAAVGVSGEFHKLTHVRTAYNEAGEALRNANLQKDSAVAFFEQVAGTEHIRNGYNITLEKEITDAVDSGDAELACGLTDQFIDRISELGAIGAEYQFYIQRLAVAILCVPYNAGIGINDLWQDGRGQIFRELSNIHENGKLKTWMHRSVILPVTERVVSFRKDSSRDIIWQIEKLVDKMRGDVTLEECAEQLCYHPSYIWKVLKNERNQTFTELVNQKKLALARTMLLETNATVADIAESLGYSNVQNFIRFFSKMTGTTPGKYRKERRDS